MLTIKNGRPYKLKGRMALLPSVAGSGLGLVFCLAVFRLVILRSELAAVSWDRALGLFATGFRQDFAVAVGLTAGFAGLAHFSGRRLVAGVFLVVCLILVLWGAANIEMVRMLGGPLNLAWLYYSDFMTSNAALSGILQSLTPQSLGLVVLVTLGFFVVAVVASRLVAGLRLGTQHGAAVLALTLVPIAVPTGEALPRGKEVNAAVAFLQSLSATGQDGMGLEESEVAGGNPLAPVAVSGTRPLKPLNGQIKNVVFFVLESIGAEYVDNYGSRHGVTPVMAGLAPQAMRFDAIYTPAPATNYALISLLAGAYPEIAERSISDHYPELAMETIAGVLQGRGYRTGFFDSSDLRFQKSREFFSHNNFETMEDYHDWSCGGGIHEPQNTGWEFVGAGDDLCTAEAMTAWLARERERPFFAVLKTGLTHYPYFSEGKEKYSEDANFNRYLNGLKTADQGLGKLMAFLEEEKLAASTLVVVLGDHGEAFGRHGTFGHATGLHEENVHIPLLLINKQLFSGEISPVLGSVIDIAPTTLDILGIKAPSIWQGSSLFAGERAGRAFFIAPWNGFQAGYREGSRKVIYHSDSGSFEIYDLSSDPLETNDLGKTDAAAREEAKQVLAGFVAMQGKYFRGILGGPLEGPAEPLTLTLYMTGTKFKNPPKAEIRIDGDLLGSVAVIAAPSNAERPAVQADIDRAVTGFVFPLAERVCAKRLDIRFLNDEWAGDNRPGDTNFYIAGALIGDQYYDAKRFKVDTAEAGGMRNGYMGLWRVGAVHLDLARSARCVGQEMTQ